MNFEQPPVQEITPEEKAEMIRESKSFDDLYEAIQKIGPVEGSTEVFEPDNLIDIINRVQSGELTLTYVTRTHGIRDAVERLMKQAPDDPKEREAAVALELPKEEVESAVIEETERREPPELSEREAAVALELPVEKEEVVAKASPEQSKEPPIEPLNDRDREFYEDASESGVTGLRVRYPQNEGDRQLQERYISLQKRLSQIKRLNDPVSFEQLQKTLASTSGFKEGDSILESGQILSTIEKIRKGEEKIDVLPQTLRWGVEKLVAEDVLDRLKENKTIEIKDHEWDIFLQKFPVQQDYLGSRTSNYAHEYPKIGDKNLRTRDAEIDGELVWSDGKEAIFKTENGFRNVPLEDIVFAEGKTYKEIKDEEDKKRRERGSQNSRARSI